MNFRTALGVAVTIVMTSASLLIPTAASAQETTTTTEASTEQATTNATETTETTTAASAPDTQDSNTDSKSDPNKDLQDLSNDLSNNKDKDKDGSITFNDKGAIESVGSVTTDTIKFIGAIVKVLAGAAGLIALLGKAFPAVKDMIQNIARGGHL